ncbi:hypothetical protein [Nitrospira sp. BLG_1]|uniref:hypothetical protein n=1 Tax=Nitrospira sp. BLG_1 TaxID=3395883 RepID=UPI0039BD11E5
MMMRSVQARLLFMFIPFQSPRMGRISSRSIQFFLLDILSTTRGWRNVFLSLKHGRPLVMLV